MRRVKSFHLLWRYIEHLNPEVNNLDYVDTGDDKEDTWTSSAAGKEETQPEHDSSLVFLRKSFDIT